MAFLGTTVLGMFSSSPAEKAFRPWWDNIEDHLVYTIVILGILIAPTCLVLGFAMDCNYCSRDNSCDYDHQNSYNVDDPGMNAFFVRKFCANHSISAFIRYFPLIILMMATTLVLLDRPFVRIMFNSNNMDEMLKLLTVEDPHSSKFDGSKELRELNKVKYSISANSNFFLSYLLRTVISMAVSATFAAIFIIFWKELDHDIHYCKVHYLYWYECVGHTVEVYQVVSVLTTFLLCVYFLLNLYNLAWLMLPSLGKLRRLMAVYKASISNNAWMGELDQLYFRSRDTQLLFNLLALSQGLAVPLRSLALVDKEFNLACIPTLEKNASSDGKWTVTVKEGSFLAKLQATSGMILSFQVEFPDSGEQVSFVANNGKLEASLGDKSRLETGEKTVNMMTLVNGKVIAVMNISIVGNVYYDTPSNL